MSNVIAKYRNHILLHFIVVVFGFTAIIRRYIDLPSLSVVWYRMAIAFVALFVFMWITKNGLKESWRARAKFLLVGILVAAHWLFFFEGIEVANSSICLAGLASTSLFVAFVEPLIFRRRIRPMEILFGGLVIVGLLLIIYELQTDKLIGLYFGIISAVLAALFSTINGKFIAKHNANSITLWEMLGGTLAATIYLALKGDLDASLFAVPADSWIWILILAIVCTSFAYVVSVMIMRELSPFTVSLAVNLEPVYGMLLAVALFDDEQMSPGFYGGAGVILLTIVGNALYKRYLNRKKAAAAKAS